jgi:hypothetical protein
MTDLEEIMRVRDALEAFARALYYDALDVYHAERDKAWAEYKAAKEEMRLI